jgi:hypothetical protein
MSELPVVGLHGKGIEMGKRSLRLLGMLSSLTTVLFLTSCAPFSSDSEEYGPFFVSANVGYSTPSAGITNVYARICMNGLTPVDDAIVTLDGITVPWDGLVRSGIYMINSSVAFGPYAPGDTLELIAESADREYTVIGSAQMPEQLSILSPTAVGGPYDADAGIAAIGSIPVCPGRQQPVRRVSEKHSPIADTAMHVGGDCHPITYRSSTITLDCT